MPKEPIKTDEEKIETALTQLSSSEEDSALEWQQEEDLSPTLQNLPRHLQPKERTACDTCPNAMWFATPVEVKCYCRIMYLVTWSTKEPTQLTDCDGKFISREG